MEQTKEKLWNIVNLRVGFDVADVKAPKTEIGGRVELVNLDMGAVQKEAVISFRTTPLDEGCLTVETPGQKPRIVQKIILEDGEELPMDLG